MTRKNFRAIAAILNKIKKDHSYGGFLGAAYCVSVDKVAEDMADYFATENKFFNKDKFIEAVG